MSVYRFLHPQTFSITYLIIILTLFFYCEYCSAIEEQGQALLEWKKGLNSSTDVLRTWNSLDALPCKWFGITCNGRNQVIMISLKSLDLQGSLPSNLQSLQSLKTIVISFTNISGEIPRAFGDYHELSFIDLSSNVLSGEIPVEICGLRKLQSLSLSSNSFRGVIPSDIGNLTGLVYLTLFDNELTGNVPKSIGMLSKLEVFRAGGNQNLKGEVPSEIGSCASLRILGLAETSISGILPSSLGLLKKVQTIAIYTSLISGAIPDDIANCTELQNLYLYQNSLSGSIPKGIGKLAKLQSLLLWENSLVGAIPEELGNCVELTVIDLSENMLSGAIPLSFGNLVKLEELQLSINQLTGTIPSQISNCKNLMHLEVDNNGISGEIPESIGDLKSLTLLFAWKNRLTGKIPDSLAECQSLQALDLSYNHLFGPIPKNIFGLQNLTKLLLLSNDLSGFIPPNIGNCTNLYRFRVNGNNLAATIPTEIGALKNLNFLDMSNNKIVGSIPASILGCEKLEYLDLHGNGLTGSLPEVLPKSLQFVDISNNRLTGSLTSNLGSLSELTKLLLGKNQFSGNIPSDLGSCSKLQLLDLGDNLFTGEVPKELAKIPVLEISLNLSCNHLSGIIPSQFSNLDKLGILDISHNKLIGNVDILASLQNLVVLNISFNEFSGEMPNTLFFKKLPLSDVTGNRALYISGGLVEPEPHHHSNTSLKLAMSILISASAVLLLFAVYMIVRANNGMKEAIEEGKWEVTLYQKLDLSIEDIIRHVNAANIIGTGSSGVVYKVPIPNGDTLAVKKMWSSPSELPNGNECEAFISEIRTLGAIRHRNIVRLLGWCTNKNIKLLFYDYLPNGSLSSLLHGGGKGLAEWEDRYDVVLGVAHALAYLHHDCVPAILHGDVKAMNVLLGPKLEPYLADFGLAKIVGSGNGDNKSSSKPQLAGSYGYMAPEHASLKSITEKSDIYSFGVLLLEVLTGRHPLDPTLPRGAPLVQWVRDHLNSKRDLVGILDPKLQGRPDTQIHEMVQTIAVALLCISSRAIDRPMMKDVVAMLIEIRHIDVVRSELDLSKGGTPTNMKSPSPTRASRTMVSEGSSHCSFAFSDDDSH